MVLWWRKSRMLPMSIIQELSYWSMNSNWILSCLAYISIWHGPRGLIVAYQRWSLYHVSGKKKKLPALILDFFFLFQKRKHQFNPQCQLEQRSPHLFLQVAQNGEWIGPCCIEPTLLIQISYSNTKRNTVSEQPPPHKITPLDHKDRISIC